MVNHQISLVANQQHPFLPVSAHLFPAIGQDIKILRPLDTVAGFLQGICVKADKLAITGNGAVSVPNEAVRTLGNVIEQQRKVSVCLSVLFGVCFFFNKLVQIREYWKILWLQSGNVRIPCDTKLPVQLY